MEFPNSVPKFVYTKAIEKNKKALLLLEALKLV